MRTEQLSITETDLLPILIREEQKLQLGEPQGGHGCDGVVIACRDTCHEWHGTGLIALQ